MRNPVRLMPLLSISISIRTVELRLYLYCWPSEVTSTILKESQVPANPSP